MINFEYCNKTKIIFGKGTENQVGKETAQYAKRILLHHSGGSAVRSGLMDRVKASLKEAGVEWVELTGVLPNPRLSLVKEGINIARNEKLEMILAVGGGSAIDSAKAIAVGAVNDGDIWDFFERKKTADKALPVAAVLTIPAAGSESSISSVITNEEGPWKRGINFQCIRPVFSILNPELTYTLPPYQTACGITDMMAHIMERYFTKEPNVELTDELCEGALRTIIRNARKIFSGATNNYDARAEIMWAGAIAHNGILDTGRIGDWASHALDHELSALFDLAHGAGLAIIFPAWMKYNIKEDNASAARFARFAAKVWGVDGAFYDKEQAALEGVSRMEHFFKSIGMPVRFADANINPERIPEMAKRVVHFGTVGNFRKLEERDAVAIYKMASN
ncbi:MAG: iron-containing alcohol dehydrogenase [Treponema sp.]|nr:iron-containing alcohol dehydrogenase [Treponema sp.]MCL2237894.1 iron-containing alcohol dehydrogenase [Treponema sp.]